jgi:putative Ca2+/H+ antiporter (TMEM165/GDT1 family)
MISFGHSLLLVALAEMGDKTQLLTMTFGARFSSRLVLLAIGAATLVLNAIAAVIGVELGLALPRVWIATAAGVAFLLFGLWALRGGGVESAGVPSRGGEHARALSNGGPAAGTAGTSLPPAADGEHASQRASPTTVTDAAGLATGGARWEANGETSGSLSGLGRLGPFLTIAGAFFLAELGDKSTLATAALASQYQVFVPVWLGASAGMLAADGLAVVVGDVVGRRVPERALRSPRPPCSSSPACSPWLRRG